MNSNTHNAITQLKEELTPLIKTVKKDGVKSNIEVFFASKQVASKRVKPYKKELSALKKKSKP